MSSIRPVPAEEASPMKFVIASSPFAGHLSPLLQVAGLLRGRGHEIIVHTAAFLRDRCPTSTSWSPTGATGR